MKGKHSSLSSLALSHSVLYMDQQATPELLAPFKSSVKCTIRRSLTLTYYFILPQSATKKKDFVTVLRNILNVKLGTILYTFFYKNLLRDLRSHLRPLTICDFGHIKSLCYQNTKNDFSIRINIFGIKEGKILYHYIADAFCSWWSRGSFEDRKLKLKTCLFCQ